MPQDRIAKLRGIKARQHLSYEELGHALGVHPISVFRWLQKGVVPRSRAYLRAIDQFIAKNGNRKRRKRRYRLEHKSGRQAQKGKP